MTAGDWLLVLAVLLSPIVAMRVSRALDRRQERRRRLSDAFHTLLATRAERATPRHAKALNTIGMEFHTRRLLGPLSYQSEADAKVLESWHVYRLHLNTPPNGETGATHAANVSAWQRRADELLSDLLCDLARTLGYGFGRGFLERGMYTPSAMPPLSTQADETPSVAADTAPPMHSVAAATVKPDATSITQPDAEPMNQTSAGPTRTSSAEPATQPYAESTKQPDTAPMTAARLHPRTTTETTTTVVNSAPPLAADHNSREANAGDEPAVRDDKDKKKKKKRDRKNKPGGLPKFSSQPRGGGQAEASKPLDP